jgi:hypothetical protein
MAWLVMPILSSISLRSLLSLLAPSTLVGLIAVYCIASNVLFQSFSSQFALRLLPLFLPFSPASRPPSLASRLIHAVDPGGLWWIVESFMHLPFPTTPGAVWPEAALSPLLRVGGPMKKLPHHDNCNLRLAAPETDYASVLDHARG